MVQEIGDIIRKDEFNLISLYCISFESYWWFSICHLAHIRRDLYIILFNVSKSHFKRLYLKEKEYFEERILK